MKGIVERQEVQRLCGLMREVMESANTEERERLYGYSHIFRHFFTEAEAQSIASICYSIKMRMKRRAKKKAGEK